MKIRTRLVYSVLIAVWAIIVVWQVVEHRRVVRSEQAKLIDRAKDISKTCGVILRSQRRFFGVPRDRLESSLSDLVKPPSELKAIAVLNQDGDVIASAPASFEPEHPLPAEPYWASDSVSVPNLVDLGTNATAEAQPSTPIIVAPPRRDTFGPPGTNRPTAQSSTVSRADGPPPPPAPETVSRASDSTDSTNAPPRPRGRRGRGEGDARPDNGDGRPPPRPFDRPGGGDGRPPRPFWMSDEEYKTLIQQQGVHSFVLVLSTQTMHAATHYDLWLRAIISALASVSVLGLGLAWRNVTKSSDLELRLVRAAELNSSLKEMNLAAAGLAHETRNPLNIIRGLAQMMSKQTDAPPEIRSKTKEIIDEADRVSAQLNEFINFSRPREVRRSAVALNSAVGEVVRALGSDLEEKSIRLVVAPGMPTIEADDQLLRQALFNLLLNAVQAVKRGGEIHVVAEKTGAEEGRLEIRDDGPGVPPERRAEIFKPYFTTQAKGTGLGLAVVQQIVRAHGWDIECLPNEPHGAVFRISHLNFAA